MGENYDVKIFVFISFARRVGQMKTNIEIT